MMRDVAACLCALRALFLPLPLLLDADAMQGAAMALRAMMLCYARLLRAACRDVVAMPAMLPCLLLRRCCCVTMRCRQRCRVHTPYCRLRFFKIRAFASENAAATIYYAT